MITRPIAVAVAGRGRQRRMSHPALFRAVRSGTLDHVRSADRDPGPQLFSGEVLTSHLVGFSEKYHFSDKAKREEGGGKSDSKDSKKKSPIHKKGSDADKDGKKNEKRKKDRNEDGDTSDSWDDSDGDGKPNKVDKDSHKYKGKKEKKDDKKD